MGYRQILKVFVPFFIAVTLGYFCVIYLLGWRPGGKKEKKALPNAVIPVASYAPAPQSYTPEASGIVNTPVPACAYDYRFVRRLPRKPFNVFLNRMRSGIVVDLNSGRVLWEKNSRTPVPIASLTKLMTSLLVMEHLERNRENLSWGTMLTIGKAPEMVERSCVFGLKRGERFAVGELMAAMMINSHNDAAAQMAETVAGDVPQFVRLMNRRAAQLGLASAKFNSPNGLPQGKERINSLCSAQDVVRICEKLMPHEKLMQLCRETYKTMHTGKRVYSHNNLLKRNPVPGIFGFKTGFTNRAGFCIAFGVRRQGRTIAGCVTGFRSARERDDFCRQLIEWAFKTR